MAKPVNLQRYEGRVIQGMRGAARSSGNSSQGGITIASIRKDVHAYEVRSDCRVKST